MEDHLPQRVRVERRAVDEAESRRANGPDWDRVRRRVPGHPRRVPRRRRLRLGSRGAAPRTRPACSATSTGKDVLEVGSRRRPVLALGPRPRRPVRRPRPVGPPAPALAAASTRRPGSSCPSVLGTATALPFADDVLRRRVLLLRRAAVRRRHRRRRRPRSRGCCAPAARFAFSVTHPTRWSFPDDPSEAGLTATSSYWDRTPYVEVDDDTGRVAYVEHHRTLGDWVGAPGRARLPDRRACSSRSGPRTTTGSGAAGRACAGGSPPGRRSSPRTWPSGRSSTATRRRDLVTGSRSSCTGDRRRLRSVRNRPSRNSGTPMT